MSHPSSQHPQLHKRLPPEVNRCLYVRNLPFNVTCEDMYDIFGKHGAIRQVRLGQTKATRGTAYVVYEDVYDAKRALENLSGFNVANRYLIVLYFNPSKHGGSGGDNAQLDREEAALRAFQRKHGVSGNQS